MTIVWLPRAKEDLIKQTAWLEAHRGHQVVVQYFEQVYAAIERLGAGDLVLYRLHDARRNIRCCHVNKHTLLYYRPLEGSVELMTFFDTRQDPGKLRL